MKKLRLLSLLLIVGLCTLAGAAEKQKSLKDRIKSVSNRLYVKSGRLELTVLPMTSISLNDAFYQKLGGGAGIAYHFNEAFSAQALVTYSLNLDTDHASSYTISAGGKSTIPYAGKRTILASADFCWSPIYGKISLASEWTMHFDTYIMAGFGAIGGEQVRDSSFAFGLDAGLGARLFFSRSLALKLEFKDYMLFTDKVSFGDIEKSDVQHQLMFNIGLSFFFLDGNGGD